jgi:hypothetical protein
MKLSFSEYIPNSTQYICIISLSPLYFAKKHLYQIVCMLRLSAVRSKYLVDSNF